MPAPGPHLVAKAQRVMQPVLPPRPARRLAARQMLPLHPPARHLGRVRRVADVVDDQDIADEAGHLGRDIGVVCVHIEAVHADPAGALKRDLPRPRLVGDVVKAKPAFVVGVLFRLLQQRDIARLDAQFFGQFGMVRLAPEQAAQIFAHRGQLLGLAADAAIVALGIDDHQIARDARLVAVRIRVIQLDRSQSPAGWRDRTRRGSSCRAVPCW